MKNVLILSPHADDAELGCGGFMARTVAEGGKVTVALMTAGAVNFRHRGTVTSDERVAECWESLQVIGCSLEILSRDLDGKLYTSPQNEFVAKLDDIQEWLKPDVVLIPLPSSHQDHRYTWEVGIATTRPSAAKHRPALVAAYEYPASGWGDGAEANASKGGIYVDISHYWSVKQAALEKYETQMRGAHHLFSINGADQLSRLRGLESGFERAELFHTLRMLV